jgi:two-component system cell cycle response regulator
MVGLLYPRILLVEDDPDTADRIRQTLTDHFGSDCVTHCATMAEALAEDEQAIDLVLTDMTLPDGSGLDLLTRLLDRRADLPVVLVTESSIHERALAAIRQGAYDYIAKAGDYLSAILVIVEKNLTIWKTKQENARLHDRLKRTLEELRVKNSQLEELVLQLKTVAAKDPLTGLANRRAFGQAMEQCFAEACRYGHDLACIMIDLDGFKNLNDTLGHPAGDEMLQRTARVLKETCRRSDIAGRFGGDEFILLMPQTDMSTARQAARRILDQFVRSARDMLGDSETADRISISMGLATLHDSKPADPEQLIAHADAALYSAKQSRGTNIMGYQPQDANAPAA